MDKKRVKSLLYGTEIRITGIISNGLVNKQSRKVILRQIYSEIRAVNRSVSLNNAENRLLWANSVRRLDNLSRKSFYGLKKADLNSRSEIVYDLIRKEFDKIESEKNELAGMIETDRKARELDRLLEDGVFYLCSCHKNPAVDHADYEGKIYISSDWELRCDDDKRIKAYIRNHDVKTIESVVYDKPYLITRPNCRHFLISVSVDEVLHNSVKKLLKNYGMYMVERKSVNSEYVKYYDRLKAMRLLEKYNGSTGLKNDIKRTRGLLRKHKIKKDRI